MITAGAMLLADNDTDKGSPIGLFLLLIIAVAVYFLYRSMSRHIRKLPQDFQDTPSETAQTQPVAAHADEPVAALADEPLTPRADEPDRP